MLMLTSKEQWSLFMIVLVLVSYAVLGLLRRRRP
jgi:hypothetical protein